MDMVKPRFKNLVQTVTIAMSTTILLVVSYFLFISNANHKICDVKRHSEFTSCVERNIIHLDTILSENDFTISHGDTHTQYLYRSFNIYNDSLNIIVLDNREEVFINGKSVVKGGFDNWVDCQTKDGFEDFCKEVFGK